MCTNVAITARHPCIPTSTSQHDTRARVLYHILTSQQLKDAISSCARVTTSTFSCKNTICNKLHGYVPMAMLTPPRALTCRQRCSNSSTRQQQQRVNKVNAHAHALGALRHHGIGRCVPFMHWRQSAVPTANVCFNFQQSGVKLAVRNFGGLQKAIIN